MKVTDIKDKLIVLLQYGGLAGISAECREAIRSASILIDEVINMKDDIRVLTECSCPQHPMCNCCDDHACYISGDTVIEMIDKTFKESDIEI